MSWVARNRAGVAGTFAAVAALAALVGGLVWTQPTRSSVKTYVRLIEAANRQDLDALHTLCSRRYLERHVLARADEGGVVGLPRNISKNFQVWRQGAGVWLCPTNRVGPVYQFVREGGDWRFDGPVGVLRGRGEFLPLPDRPGDAEPDEESAEVGAVGQSQRR